MCDPVPADAVELCCPRCLRLLGHATRGRLYIGGACFTSAVRLPCANCRYRFRWGPDPADTEAESELASRNLRKSQP